MAARRYEISLRVLKNILRMSVAIKNIFHYSKSNFVSPRGHVISFNSLLQFMTSPWFVLGIVGGAMS